MLLLLPRMALAVKGLVEAPAILIGHTPSGCTTDYALIGNLRIAATLLVAKRCSN